MQWRRRRGSGRALALPLGFKVSKFQAILYYLGDIASNFWTISYFLGKFASNFWAVQYSSDVSISVKTFFFFLEVTLIWTEKPIAFRAKFNVSFRGKAWCPPNPFELLRPCIFDLMLFDNWYTSRDEIVLRPNFLELWKNGRITKFYELALYFSWIRNLRFVVSHRIYLPFICWAR